MWPWEGYDVSPQETSALTPPSGLARYAGHSNTSDIYGGLIGEEIAAVFEKRSWSGHDDGMEFWLVMKSGYAFVYRRPNGAFWVATKKQVDREVSDQRRDLQRTVRRLGHLGTIAILAPEETP